MRCVICAQARHPKRLVVTPTGRALCFQCAGPSLARVCRSIDRLGVDAFVDQRQAYAADVLTAQLADTVEACKASRDWRRRVCYGCGARHGEQCRPASA